jgi:serine/threonine-protein kinase RsbT
MPDTALPPVLLTLGHAQDVLQARAAARALARDVGMGEMDQARFASAVSELARNAVRYGREGRCELRDESDARHLRLQACISDAGPGIADIPRALQEGYSTGGGLGLGLAAARRLVDLFDLRSGADGTRATVQIVRRRG